MEPRGLDFLYPIWRLMEARTPAQTSTGRQNDKYIGLAPGQVRVHYTKYVNNFKPQLNQLQPGQLSIRDAVNDKLTPGKLLSNYLLNITLIKLSRQR